MPNLYSHILDSRFHGGAYSTPESKALFSDVARLQKWLDVEAVLAEVQAELGMIPKEAAVSIKANAKMDRLNWQEISTGIGQTGHSLVPIIKALQKACGTKWGEFVHYGVTTQDIQDTAQSLELKNISILINRDLNKIIHKLKIECQKYKDTVMVGRTHAQPAAPITLGLKIAGWIDELCRSSERLQQIEPRVLVVQLFGAVGTASNWKDQADSLLQKFAEKLDLNIPMVSWHTSRDRIAEFVGFMALLSGTLARIADEVRLLARPEIDEISEGWQKGQVSSSTMPHKRNPENCEQVIVMHRLIKSLNVAALEAMVVDNERDYRGTRLEWVALMDSCHYCLNALQMMVDIVSNWVVNTEGIQKNVNKFSQQICSEALLFALAEKTNSKQSAYDLVFEISQKAIDENASFSEQVSTHPTVLKYLSIDEIKDIFNPQNQVIMSSKQVQKLIDRL